jgi:hypothetical protein
VSPPWLVRHGLRTAVRQIGRTAVRHFRALSCDTGGRQVVEWNCQSKFRNLTNDTALWPALAMTGKPTDSETALQGN